MFFYFIDSMKQLRLMMVWCGVLLMAGRVAKDLAEIKTVFF